MKFKFADKGEMIDACCDFAYSMPYFDESNIELMIKSRYYADEFDQEKIKTIS